MYILNFNLVIRYTFQNFLCSVRPDNHPHHSVAFNQHIPCSFRLFYIQFFCIQFKIAMCSDISQFIQTASSNPVGILHICQRKWLISVFEIWPDFQNGRKFTFCLINNPCQCLNCWVFKNCSNRNLTVKNILYLRNQSCCH